jgi:type IV pilus assembly protein PilA
MRYQLYLIPIFKSSKIKKRLNKSSGFTLVELLTVIVILGILMAVVIPSYMNQTRKARQVEAVLNINACQKKLIAYYAEKSKFTDSLETLELKQETTNFEYRVEIFPPSSPTDTETLACCFAAEKGGFGQLFTTCTSDKPDP